MYGYHVPSKLLMSTDMFIEVQDTVFQDPKLQNVNRFSTIGIMVSG